MTIFQSIILGIIQGITEFLPISSSAHLVLAPYLLGWSIPEEQIFPFDVLVQMGTLVSVIIYFWHDLIEIVVEFLAQLKSGKIGETENQRLGWWIIIATIPAGIFGIIFSDLIEDAFHSPVITALFLLVTAALLITSEKIGNKNRDLESFNWKDALWVGCAQALAVFPGISRSGSTISAGIYRNINRPDSARFAFLISIPIFIAAGIFGLFDLFEIPDLKDFLPVLLVGFITSGIVGYLVIRWLLRYLSHRSLIPFGIYCIILSVTVIIFSYAS